MELPKNIAESVRIRMEDIIMSTTETSGTTKMDKTLAREYFTDMDEDGDWQLETVIHQTLRDFDEPVDSPMADALENWFKLEYLL